MSSAADPVDLVRRAVAYLDRILKGERPGDLPIYRASRYALQQITRQHPHPVSTTSSPPDRIQHRKPAFSTS
jgi:hypothetical protein